MASRMRSTRMLAAPRMNSREPGEPNTWQKVSNNIIKQDKSKAGNIARRKRLVLHVSSQDFDIDDSSLTNDGNENLELHSSLKSDGRGVASPLKVQRSDSFDVGKKMPSPTLQVGQMTFKNKSRNSQQIRQKKSRVPAPKRSQRKYACPRCGAEMPTMRLLSRHAVGCRGKTSKRKSSKKRTAMSPAGSSASPIAHKSAAFRDAMAKIKPTIKITDEDLAQPDKGGEEEKTEEVERPTQHEQPPAEQTEDGVPSPSSRERPNAIVRPGALPAPGALEPHPPQQPPEMLRPALLPVRRRNILEEKREREAQEQRNLLDQMGRLERFMFLDKLKKMEEERRIKERADRQRELRRMEEEEHLSKQAKIYWVRLALEAGRRALEREMREKEELEEKERLAKQARLEKERAELAAKWAAIDAAAAREEQEEAEREAARRAKLAAELAAKKQLEEAKAKHKAEMAEKLRAKQEQARLEREKKRAQQAAARAAKQKEIERRKAARIVAKQKRMQQLKERQERTAHAKAEKLAQQAAARQLEFDQREREAEIAKARAEAQAKLAAEQVAEQERLREAAEDDQHRMQLDLQLAEIQKREESVQEQKLAQLKALEAEMAELHDTDTTESESEDETHVQSVAVVEVKEDEVELSSEEEEDTDVEEDGEADAEELALMARLKALSDSREKARLAALTAAREEERKHRELEKKKIELAKQEERARQAKAREAKMRAIALAEEEERKRREHELTAEEMRKKLAEHQATEAMRRQQKLLEIARKRKEEMLARIRAKAQSTPTAPVTDSVSVDTGKQEDVSANKVPQLKASQTQKAEPEPAAETRKAEPAAETPKAEPAAETPKAEPAAETPKTEPAVQVLEPEPEPELDAELDAELEPSVETLAPEPAVQMPTVEPQEQSTEEPAYDDYYHQAEYPAVPCEWCQDFGEYSAVACACSYGHVECLEALVDQKYDMEQGDSYGRSPMHFAAAYGFVDCLEVLCSHGANPLVKDFDSRTPLFYACSSNEFNCAALLIDFAAELLDVPDAHGDTPLHVCCAHSFVECCGLLLQTAADPDIENTEGHSPCNLVTDPKILEMLFDNGANLFLTDRKGRSLLFTYIAAQRYDCAAYLLEVDVEAVLLQEPDKRRDTPLHAAACNGFTHCADLLLNYAANPNLKNAAGYTAYDLAHMCGHEECAKLLAQYAPLHGDEPLPSSQETQETQYSFATAALVNQYVQRAKTSWMKFFDESSGFHYYWNKETGESSWEAPEGHSISDLSDGAVASIGTETAAATDAHDAFGSHTVSDEKVHDADVADGRKHVSRAWTAADVDTLKFADALTAPFPTEETKKSETTAVKKEKKDKGRKLARDYIAMSREYTSHRQYEVTVESETLTTQSARGRVKKKRKKRGVQCYVCAKSRTKDIFLPCKHTCVCRSCMSALGIRYKPSENEANAAPIGLPCPVCLKPINKVINLKDYRPVQSNYGPKSTLPVGFKEAWGLNVAPLLNRVSGETPTARPSTADDTPAELAAEDEPLPSTEPMRPSTAM